MNTTPDKFKTFDLPLEEQMFKDFVNELLPEFCANDMNELTNDIKDAWEEWHEQMLEHDPAVGIRSPYKI